jgi:hypothetical protein
MDEEVGELVKALTLPERTPEEEERVVWEESALGALS